MSLNRWQGIGRLTRDPDMRITPNGNSVSNITIAVDSDWKKQDGERDTNFIKCVSFGKTAEFVNNYLSKGKLAYIEGELRVRTYKDESGMGKYVTEVAVSKVQPLEWKKKDDGGLIDEINSEDPPF